MDKRASLRQHFVQEESQAKETKQYQERTAQLSALEDTVVKAFSVLIQFMDGKTTKTEVTNQLKSISTPDVDKVVQAVSKLDKDILSNKLDLKPVTDALNGMKRELGLIPKSHPKQVEQREDVKVTNLDEIKLDTSDVVSAIKALKLDVKAPIINEKDVDLKPLQDVMLDLLKAVQKQKPTIIPEFPKIPETNLTKVETKLDTSNKLLKEITEKKFGGGGGGGNGTPYVDSTGKAVNVTIESDGSVPVTVKNGGGSSSGGATEVEQLTQTELLEQLTVVFKALMQGIVDPVTLDKTLNRTRQTAIVESGTITTVGTVTGVTTVSTVTGLTNIDSYQGKILMVGQDMSAWANTVRGRIT